MSKWRELIDGAFNWRNMPEGAGDRIFWAYVYEKSPIQFPSLSSDKLHRDGIRNQKLFEELTTSYRPLDTYEQEVLQYILITYCNAPPPFVVFYNFLEPPQ